MIIFRFFALILIAVALMVLGADIVARLGGDPEPFHSLGRLWGLVHAESHAAATGGNAAGGLLSTALSAPAFAVFGILGLVMSFVFRSRT
ncbi:MAG: hypothetical protein AAGF19_10450 [Pseudomonadota bacterium]